MVTSLCCFPFQLNVSVEGRDLLYICHSLQVGGRVPLPKCIVFAYMSLTCIVRCQVNLLTGVFPNMLFLRDFPVKLLSTYGF